MTVNIPLLLLALLLLWFPRQWLRMGAVLFRRRSHSGSGKPGASLEPWNIREPGDPSVNFYAEFSKSRNYVDLFRALVGGLCVVGGLHIEPSVMLAENAPAATAKGVIAIKGIILLVGLLIQAMRYEKRRFTFYPPIFFLAGLSVGLCEPYGALFAFILIWAFNPILKSAQGFLTVYAILQVVFGNYFSGLGDKTSIYAGILCFLPVLLSLMAQRPLVIYARKGVRSAETKS